MVALELEKAGVPKERMMIEAMGERFASSEAQPDDQAFERCVEIRLESRRVARQQLIRTWCRGGTAGITLDPPDSSSLAPTMNIQIVDFRNQIEGESAAHRLPTG